MILIDTDVLVEILDKHSDLGEEASKKINASGEQFCTSVISLHEILYGLIRYSRSIDNALNLPILDYTKDDALLSSELEVEAERKGNPTLRSDSMIAAIAIDNGCKLYTSNRKHFKDFPGLQFF